MAPDSAVLRARGGVRHKKDREAGKVRPARFRGHPEARWAKSGWHGWVFGWKPRLALTAVAGAWRPRWPPG